MGEASQEAAAGAAMAPRSAEDLFEGAFEAFDSAAVLFDGGWGCVAANARFRRLCPGLSPDMAIAPGAPIGDVLDRLYPAGPGAGRAGRDADDAVASLRTAIWSYRRDFDVPVHDGRMLVGCATPTRGGGCLVTLRDRRPDVMGELQALKLLGEAFEEADMGMIVWDADLVVQTANAAWSKMLIPVAPGMSGRDYAARLIAGGLFDLPEGTTPEAMIDGLVRQALGQTMRMEGLAPDGRKLMLYSFRTPTGGIMGLATDVTELRAAEAQVSDALSEIVESLDEGVALYDADLRLRMSNSALHRLAHGDDPAMPYGTHLSEHFAYVVGLGHIALDDGVPLAEFTSAIEAAARSLQRNVPVAMADGRILSLSTFATPVGGYLLTSRDVTEKLRAEDAEREADARVRTIVESLGEGVALYDPNLKRLMNNPAFRHLVMEDRIDLPPGATLRDEILACIEAGIIGLPEGGTAEDVLGWIEACIRDHRTNVELPMADGRVLEASNFPTPDGGFLVAMRDVTARKRAEESTREFDQLIRTIVDASPATLMVSRLDDGRVIYAPPATFAQARGLDMTRDVNDPEMRRRYLDALLPTGQLRDFPLRFHKVDRTPVDCLISARVIEYRGDRLIVSCSLDVTESLALQAELERQREAAHQNEKLSALGELLAGVAHELNNPLSVVVGHTMMLRDAVTDPDLTRRVDKISTAADRSARIVKMFLAMARQRPTRFEACDVNELIAVALDVSAHGLEEMGAAVDLRLDPSLPPVAADPDQIAQVLSNLIVNAEHAMAGRPAPGLMVETRRAGGAVEIAIEDNGPGVPDALARRIFEPFYTTKDVGAGTGVGLAFCHRIVRSHGGELKLSRGAAGGAVFTIRLPVCGRQKARAPASDPLAVRRARVLVLDDEAELADLIRETLAGAGHEVTVETSAQRALELCCDAPFDAILSDVRMPGMDGHAFLAALRLAAPDMAARLAFLTGDAMSEGTDLRLRASGRPYAEKPLRPAEILGIVDDLLRGAQG